MPGVIEIVRSGTFDHWLRRLRDPQAKARVLARVRRLGLGNPGDVRPVGEGQSEMRIDYGPGYRVYYLQRGPGKVVLLNGGSKRTQRSDIVRANRIAKEWKSRHD